MSAYGGSRMGQSSIRSEAGYQSYPQNQAQVFSFNKTVYDQQVFFRLRAQQREDFTLPLGLKISLVAQSN